MNRKQIRQDYKLCKTVESILNLTGLNSVLPIHLRENVLIYTVGSTALTLQVLANSSPSGSYKVLRKWLSKLATSSEMDLGGDIIAVFDNNQTMQRRWNVKVANKMFVQVVTIIAFFQISPTGDVECKSSMKPGMWLLKRLECTATNSVKYIDQEPSIRQMHYDHHLYPHWTRIIKNVTEEQVGVSEDGVEKFQDSIDEYVKKKQEDMQYKHCFDCGTSRIPMNKINCTSCKTNLKLSKQRYLGLTDNSTYVVKERKERLTTPKSYKIEASGSSVSFAEVQEARQDCEINKCSVSEPVFVNPCSYEAVNSILREIGKKSGVARYNGGVGSREFVIIFCDGSPYNLCFRVIMSTYRCPLCAEVISGEQNMNKHLVTTHNVPSEDQDAFPLEYDWALLQPGPGHIEMNMIKGITSTCWEIFWRVLAQTMNFKSDKALQCCRQVTDHHKGWQLFTIAYEALSHELIVPFVREELKKASPNLTALAFANFQKNEIQDPTYTLICDLCFEFMGAISMYRTGVRDANPEYMTSGLGKFCKLWSGRNHPLYRELEMSFTLSLARMPTELQNLVKRSWSLNTSGISGTNEGPDFKLEAINKTIQHWLPAVPSGIDWMQCCTQHDELQVLRQKLFTQMGARDPKDRSRHHRRELEDEIREFRRVLRENEYLSMPRRQRDLVALDGSALDPDLVNFSALCREKRASYCDAYLAHESRRSAVRTNIPFKQRPVFVTQAERTEYDRVENKTIDELKTEIPNMIAAIADESVRDAFSDAWLSEVLKRKGTTKKDYIAFYEEVNSCLENINDYLALLRDTNEVDD